MRLRHAALALLIAILLGVIARYKLISQKSESESTLPAIQSTMTATPAPSVSASSTPTTTPTTAQETQKGSNGPLEFPTLREVREQVAHDPHHTPQALIQFAKDLSARAENAKQSQATAQAFFGELEDCLSNEKDPSESVPMPAQLTCLTTAEEFAKLYPNELGSRLKPLQQNASPELKRIREALDRF